MKGVLLWIFLVGIWIDKLSAQNQLLVDSLERVVLTTSDEVSKYDALHQLAVQYTDRDNERALRIIHEAELVALHSRDSISIMRSQRLKAQILYRLGKLQLAVATAEPLLGFANVRNNEQEYLSIVNLLGVCYMAMTQFDAGFTYHFKALERAKIVNDDERVAISLMNIGIAYYKLKDYKKALPFMMDSYRIRQALGNVSALDAMNLSLCYSYIDDFKNAASYLDLSLRMCGSDCSPLEVLHIKYASGCIYFAQGRVDIACDEFRTSLALARSAGDDRMCLDNIYMLAKIYISRKDLKSAKLHLAEAERIIKEGIPYNMEKIKVYEQLSELYLLTMDFKNASRYQAKYIKLRDSIYNETVTTTLMKVESKFHERANQLKIAAQKAVILDRDETIKRQMIFILFATLLSLTTVIALIFLFRNYKLKKHINVLLEGKFRERTIQLDVGVHALSKALIEKDVQIERLSRLVTETVNSLTGLHLIALKQPRRQDTDDYAHHLFEITNRLDKGLAKLNTRCPLSD